MISLSQKKITFIASGVGETIIPDLLSEIDRALAAKIDEMISGTCQYIVEKLGQLRRRTLNYTHLKGIKTTTNNKSNGQMNPSEAAKWERGVIARVMMELSSMSRFVVFFLSFSFCRGVLIFLFPLFSFFQNGFIDGNGKYRNYCIFGVVPGATGS